MVGTARFELATSRTPSVRATRLRHVPSNQSQYGWKMLVVNGRELLFRLAAQLLKLFVALLKQIENLLQLRGNLS